MEKKYFRSTNDSLLTSWMLQNRQRKNLTKRRGSKPNEKTNLLWGSAAVREIAMNRHATNSASRLIDLVEVEAQERP